MRKTAEVQFPPANRDTISRPDPRQPKSIGTPVRENSIRQTGRATSAENREYSPYGAEICGRGRGSRIFHAPIAEEPSSHALEAGAAQARLLDSWAKRLGMDCRCRSVTLLAPAATCRKLWYGDPWQ
jgi:hypothetical protein